MNSSFGQWKELPVLVVHCGAGSYSGRQDVLEGSRQAVETTLRRVWPMLDSGSSAVAGVAEALAVLEDSPWSNAGTGSVLQLDGLPRLTAAIMDGARQKLSGVMLVSHVKNPSRLALALQEREESVLGPLGAQLLARELGIPPENPLDARSMRDLLGTLDASASPGLPKERMDTVGVVAVDRQGLLAAGTSTGGRASTVERVSDAATVAGTYASRFAAVSCTGVGEQLVDDGFAVRLETRIRDGKSLAVASELAFSEATQANRHYGWIAVSSGGCWATCHTTPNMPSGVWCAGMAEPRLNG
ncbi:MAG: isoaspartyl peptidase/L-asparaginase [Bdellovibrionales bacterium]|nr:isoaspartyl peptidase/L-asparaginase [Bdellovibrionales bacterium]